MAGLFMPYIIGLLVVLLLLLLLREVNCWYWKINRVIELLSQIQKDLAEIKQSIKQEEHL